MFDDLRKEANSLYEETPPTQAEAETPATKKSAPAAQPRSKLFLGMTGTQRFVVSFMIFLMVCVIGFMFLLIANKIGF